ncbi:TPA: Cna B-type domain-containing protein, partial [Bacillus pseudomycoides]|nr:Cna B-type domain-containing protein [Bacillus pseudomycoides]
MGLALKRVTSIFSIIMIFMFTIGQSLLPIIASAQELSTTGFVDSFTFDKTTLNYGDKAKISVTFSDKSGNNMKSGDTLILTLPRELTGFNATIPLNDEQGNNFGTCDVTAGKVVCTFNDIVEKLHNIKGHFYFTVVANSVGQTTNVETNLGTTLDKQTVTIKNSSGGSTGSTPFAGKTGDIQASDPNKVRWFLRINTKKEYLGRDIVVSDSLQEGQTLNKDGFRIIVNDREELTIKQFEDQRYGYVQFNDDGRSFTVVINWSMGSARSFNVSYTSTITASGKSQESFKNDYKIDYQILYKQPVSESGSAKVANIASGGGAQGDLPPKGTLRIVKYLEGAEEKVIPNVSFKLYKESGEQVGNQYTTDEKGIIEIKDLTPGKYYVQEVSAPNYIDFDPQAKVTFEVKSDAVNGIKLPISNKVKTTSVTGTKTWKDDNQNRPAIIKVDLFQNGQKLDTKEVSEATGWKYEFKNLAVYDTDGKEYKYEVKEQPVDGYQSEVNGYDITNTKVGKTKVEGTKTWKDNNASSRPSAIKVNLLQNGTVIDTKEVTETNNWKYTFVDLPAYDANGKAYTYTVKEQSVPGYESKVNGYDITNTKVDKTTVEGTKIWKDNDVTDRPSSIQIELFRNGEKIDTKEVTATNSWKYTFDNLEAYDAEGKAYKYEVKEEPVAGYKSEVNGYDITNTKVGKTKVEGTKTWNDNNATDRPSTIKVDLLQNATVIQTKEVTAATNWKYTFDNLEAYDAEGKAYKYEVKEEPVAGYKSEVNGYDITNTKVGKVTVEGTKTWKDNNATDRPSTIKVDLLQNGKVIATKEVSEATSWKYAFTDLAAYDVDGKVYKYEVKEQPVNGYESKVTGYDITNTKVPQL